jgi:predicted DNA-binding WGR domain protein
MQRTTQLYKDYLNKGSKTTPLYPLHLELEAHNPTHNMHRYYSIDVSLDLLGDWLITTRYGRMGQSGQCKSYGYSCQDDAQRKFNQLLHKRLKSHKRLGTTYIITKQNTL